MMFKLSLIVLLAIVVRGAPQDDYNYILDPYHTYREPQPIYQRDDRERNAEYEFGYQVNDETTGDVKLQQESRKDGVVRGRYELNDPDGYRRIVEYTADAIHGFNAVVRRIPIPGFRAPTYVHHAPPVYSTPAPLIHAPIAHTTAIPPPRRHFLSTISTTVAPFIAHTAAPAYVQSATHIPQSAVYFANHNPTAPSLDLQAPIFSPTGFAYKREQYQ